MSRGVYPRDAPQAFPTRSSSHGGSVLPYLTQGVRGRRMRLPSSRIARVSSRITPNRPAGISTCHTRKQPICVILRVVLAMQVCTSGWFQSRKEQGSKSAGVKDFIGRTERDSSKQQPNIDLSLTFSSALSSLRRGRQRLNRTQNLRSGRRACARAGFERMILLAEMG